MPTSDRTPAAGAAAPHIDLTPTTHQSPLQLFLSLSATLTGFSAAELWGTALVHKYYALLPSIVGPNMFGDFMSRWRDVHDRAHGSERTLEKRVKDDILADATFGPLARNLAALWYLGQWNQLPAEWRNAHGASAYDTTFVVSPQSYSEGLVWKAMHTHPPTAKMPGYGSWALPPEGADDQ